jgi:hypothetical protein
MTSNVDSGAPGRGLLVLQGFDKMGSKDGFLNNKLLDDFGSGVIRPERSAFSDEIVTIIATRSSYRD